MKREEAERIIIERQLTSYSFFENREDAQEEMVIKKEAGKWIVYATDERASKITGGEAKFDNESDALDNFIRRLRSLNNVLNRR